MHGTYLSGPILVAFLALASDPAAAAIEMHCSFRAIAFCWLPRVYSTQPIHDKSRAVARWSGSAVA